MEEPFWEKKTLSQLSDSEWESLCDGCAKCCLNKIVDFDAKEIIWTSVACKFLNQETCRCGDYENRHNLVEDCLSLSPKNVEDCRELFSDNAEDCLSLSPENLEGVPLLPPTCAYRLIAEGKGLYWWHPLVSGDPETVHMAGISVRGRVVSEEGMEVEDYEKHIVEWPAELVEVERDFS